MYKVCAVFLCNMAEMLLIKAICTLSAKGNYKENAVYGNEGIERVCNIRKIFRICLCFEEDKNADHNGYYRYAYNICFMQSAVTYERDYHKADANEL